MNWYAIYTKPRQEDVVASRLQDIGVNLLNPKFKSGKYRHNRFTDIIEPLFPCYLFANFDRDKYFHMINYTRGVRYILGKGNPVVLPDEIINTIKERIDEDKDNLVLIRPQRLKKGDRVQIKDGPFKDFCGIFERETRGPERVLILLDTIYYRLEIDSSFLIRM